ncbi:ABC transporter substrate-binding protein [Bdellovibrionota bacterium FG-2]
MYKFLALFLLNTFGDILVISTIPMYIIEKTGSFTKGTYFTILVFVAILITARLAGFLTQKFNPLKFVAVIDLLSALLVLGLLTTLRVYGFHFETFLGECAVLALVVNLPLFAKYNLIHRYFVDEKDLTQFSLLQGRASGLILILSMLSAGFLFPKLGFQGILWIDIATYLPCAFLLIMNRKESPLGYYSRKSATPTETNPGSHSAPVGQPILVQFLLVALFLFLVQNLRSHLLLSIFKVQFQHIGLNTISLFAAVGAIFSLLLARFTNHYYLHLKSVPLALLAALTLPVGIAFFLEKYPFLCIFLASVFINDWIAIGLSLSRALQMRAEPYYPMSKLVSLSMGFSCFFGMFGVLGFSKIGVNYGFGLGFILISSTIFLSHITLLPFLKRKRAIASIATALFCMIISSFSYAAENRYTTAMSDLPRDLSAITPEMLTEDESFLKTNTMCSLIRRDINQGLIPELAQSWKIIVPDQVIAFTIREGAHDSENNEIDALYVKKSMEEQIRKTLSRARTINGFDLIKGVSECNERRCVLPGLVVEGKRGIRIELTRPWPGLLGLLEASSFVQSVRHDGKRDIPISCGPYRIAKMDETGLELTRNPYSIRPAIGGPDKFIIRVLPPKEAYKAFCTHQINDLLFYMPSKADLLRGGCTGGNFDYREVYTAGFWFISLGAKIPGLSSAILNRLKKAFNKDVFKKTWGIEATDQGRLIPRDFGLSPHTPDLTPPPLNTIAINDKSLAKTPVVIRFISGTPNESNLNQALLDWIKMAELSANIIPTKFSEFMTDLSEGKSDIYVYAEIANSPNPLAFLATFYQKALRQASHHERTKLEQAWRQYETTRSKIDLDQLELTIRRSNLFLPLFSFKRPLVISKDWTVGRYGDLGLFSVEISRFGRRQ